MGDVRHLVYKGAKRHLAYWQPTAAMRAAGFGARRLKGTPVEIVTEAERLNALWDQHRSGADIDGIAKAFLPDTIGALIWLFRGNPKTGVGGSPEFLDLKPRTRRDYSYWLDGVEASFRDIKVKALGAKAIKYCYRETVAARGDYAGYHMMGTLRALLSFAVSEEWIESNPALDVRVKMPKSRKVRWTPEQTAAMVAACDAAGRFSMGTAVMLAEWLAQRPADILSMLWSAYDGATIKIDAQAKTERELAPIPVSVELKARLDAATKTSIYIVASESTRRPYGESDFQQTFKEIRNAAGLPKELQFRDFRRTGMTEIVESSATDDAARAISGHKNRNVLSIYAIPTAATAANAMAKRTARRKNIKAQAVGKTAKT